MSDPTERLNQHEEWIKGLMAERVCDTAKGLEATAENLATFEMLKGLVDHLGLDVEEFVKGHRERRAYWLDLFLRRAEDVSAELGALLDSREQADVSDLTDAEGFPGAKPPQL